MVKIQVWKYLSVFSFFNPPLRKFRALRMSVSVGTTLLPQRYRPPGSFHIDIGWRNPPPYVHAPFNFLFPSWEITEAGFFYLTCFLLGSRTWVRQKQTIYRIKAFSTNPQKVLTLNIFLTYWSSPFGKRLVRWATPVDCSCRVVVGYKSWKC